MLNTDSIRWQEETISHHISSRWQSERKLHEINISKTIYTPSRLPRRSQSTRIYPHYEEQWHKQNEQYSVQPILNNWCDNEHDGM